MLRTKIIGKLFILVISIFIFNNAFAETENKIDTAVKVVEQLCLSGTEYGISADVDGNITIKSFNPKGSGSVTLNVREVSGATSFQNDLRIIADDKVRECTQKHIGRILDAILEVTEPQKEVKKNNTSLSKAKFLGYVPDEVSVKSFVEGDEKLYYRFSVKEPSTVKVTISHYSRRLVISLFRQKGSTGSMDTGHYKARAMEHFLMPGDFYLSVRCKESKSSTAFKMKVVGLPES